MMRPPPVVIASLAAIALTGVVFAVTATTGGAPLVGAAFLTLPLSAAACSRALRRARPALFAVSLLSLAPMLVGVLLTWPHVIGLLPYAVGALAVIGGLAGMLTPVAREWHAATAARRHLDTD